MGRPTRTQFRSAWDAELDALMQRFFVLSANDQLRAYEQIRDFLGAGVPIETKADREIERRWESLAALERVAEHLGLDGEAPTAQQFDRVGRQLGLGWTAKKVAEVWGRWRFACEALRGEKPRLTAAQQSMRHRFTGFKRTREDYQTALRLWMSTEPPLVRQVDYNKWAREYNDSISDGTLPLPMGQTIVTNLAVSWVDAVRIGRGEIDADEVAQQSRAPKRDWTSGPHDLISLGTAAQMLRLSKSMCDYLTHQPKFPQPVAAFSHSSRLVRAWLREDIETFRDTGRAPKRRRRSVRDQYYSSVELARLIGVTRHAVLRASESPSPPPTGMVGGFLYWLRRDADRWIRENKALVERRLARRRSREE